MKKYKLLLFLATNLIPVFLFAQWLETIILVETNPIALTYNSINDKIYSANYGRDSVTVIDGEQDSAIKIIRVGNEPWVLEYNPVNNKIYCANRDDNNVTVINGANDSVVATVPVGQSPRVLMYNPINNKIYCANYNDESVDVISGLTDEVITMIDVGYNPNAFVHIPQQNRIYVANYGSSSISVIRDLMFDVEETRSKKQDVRKFEIYPNPAKSCFSIHLPQTTDRLEIKLFDVTGKLVKVEKFKGSKDERISLAGIKNGIYFMKVNDMMIKEKLVVTR